MIFLINLCRNCAHLHLPPSVPECPTPRVPHPSPLLPLLLPDGPVAAGAADEVGAGAEAGGDHQVGGGAARVQGDADVEGAAEVGQVALEQAAVGKSCLPGGWGGRKSCL